MLSIIVPAPKDEEWDEKNETFVYHESGKEQILQLEHSLISLSKWESKWHKPFFSSSKTDEELLDYIKCMTLTSNVKPDVYDHLSPDNIRAINEYIKDPMTATTFSKSNSRGTSREIITSELIYCWMIQLGIPFECQKWHIERLITLIRVCEIKNAPPKKHSVNEIRSRNAALNAMRRKALNSKG